MKTKIKAAILSAIILAQTSMLNATQMSDSDVLTNCSTLMGMIGTVAIIGGTQLSESDVLVLMGQWRISAINATKDLHKISYDEAEVMYNEQIKINLKAWKEYSIADNDAFIARVTNGVKQCSDLEPIRSKYL